MSIVNRTVILNTIEPSPLSMRVPSGMPLKIAFLYTDVLGNPMSVDLAGRLQLTSRTENRTLTYAVPATDIVNGKAMAVVNAGDLTDMNGYRLRLLGTYNQEPMLFAMGLLSLIQGAGDEALPDDVIDNVPIQMVYNFDTSITIRLWNDAGKSSPYDLSSVIVSASVYADKTALVTLAPFTVTPTQLPGEVILSMPAAIVNTLPPGGWWALRVSNAAGITTLANGTVTITGTAP